MPAHYALIGYRVAQNLLPKIMQTLIEHYQLDADYNTLPVLPGEMRLFPKLMKSRNISGCNVGMPHRESVISYLDVVSPNASFCRSVNTVLSTADGLLGRSTDGAGFLYALTKDGVQVSGRTAMVLGAGGAARSIAYALALSGADVIMLAFENAEPFVSALSVKTGVFTEYLPFTVKNLTETAPKVNLVVNATPLGMAGGAGAIWPAFEWLYGLPKDVVISDVVYTPADTPLVREARQRGLQASNGLAMLVWQAVESFALFTGVTPDEETVQSILRSLQA